MKSGYLSRHKALKLVYALVIAGLDKDLVARGFISVLKNYSSIYHFDEDAKDIENSYERFPLFGTDEAELCNKIRDYCYGEYLFELALEVIHG